MASPEEQRRRSQRLQGSDLASLLALNNPTTDLQALARQGTLEASIKPPEHDEDRASRIRIVEADANEARFRRKAAFIFGLILLAIIFFSCLWVILFGNYSEQTKGWAMSLVTGIVTGFVGYLVGKQMNK